MVTPSTYYAKGLYTIYTVSGKLGTGTLVIIIILNEYIQFVPISPKDSPVTHISSMAPSAK